jgi:hypothetical protein
MTNCGSKYSINTHRTKWISKQRIEYISFNQNIKIAKKCLVVNAVVEDTMLVLASMFVGRISSQCGDTEHNKRRCPHNQLDEAGRMNNSDMMEDEAADHVCVRTIYP